MTAQSAGPVIHANSYPLSNCARFCAVLEPDPWRRQRDGGNNAPRVSGEAPLADRRPIHAELRARANPPGTNLLAFCTGFGWALRGLSGAIVALLASSIPCALLVAVLTALFELWRDSPVAQVAIRGAVAAAVGITVKTCWTIARPYFKGEGRLRVVLVGGAAFMLNAVAGIPPIEVLILAAVVGAFLPVHGSAPTH
jgi:hypothetical protein